MAIQRLDGASLFDPGNGSELGFVEIRYDTNTNRLTDVRVSLSRRVAEQITLRVSGQPIIQGFYTGEEIIPIPGDHYAVPDPNEPDILNPPPYMTYSFQETYLTEL